MTYQIDKIPCLSNFLLYIYISCTFFTFLFMKLIFYRAVIEAGFNYSDLNTLVDSKDVMIKLADCSPCKYAHKVQAPTLLLLGEKDLRVPPSQGLSYYHLLKKHGVTTK